MDTTNRNTALASAMVEELARCGVRHAVLSPGSRSTPLAVALARQPEIELTVHYDERSAGFLALGAALATGAPSVVLCTSGSAAANLHPAIVEADEAGVPLIALTADRPPELRGVGAGQTIDQLKLYGDAVRWFCEVGTHEADDPGLVHMRSVACRAFAAARGEPRPGPVHLNVAFREPLAPVPGDGDVTATTAAALRGGGSQPLTRVTAGHPAPDLDEAGTLLAAPVRGLIVAGRQANPELAAPVVELAQATGFPVLAEPTSHLRLGSHDRELVVWPYDAIARSAPSQLAPELIVRFGDMPTSKALREWLFSIDDLRQLVIDPLYGWNEPSRRASLVLRADPALAARELAARATRADEAWTESWLAAGRAAADAIAAEIATLEEPTEPGVHHALGGLYPDGALVYTASSMPIRDQEAFLPAGEAVVRFLCNRGANGIDGLVSSALGAARATGAPTFVITGDLGLYHDLNALAALDQVESPVRIVVLNNQGGGIFHFLPQAELMDAPEFERLLATPANLTPKKAAAAFDLPHQLIDNLNQLPAALALDGDPHALIEIPVDRHRNVEIHQRLFDGVAAALHT